jgi:hypothetical protein
MITEITSEGVASQIEYLEKRRAQEYADLKYQLRLTGERLKPINLIKSAVKELTEDDQIRSFALKAGLGLIFGLVAKKVLQSVKDSSADDNHEKPNSPSLASQYWKENKVALIQWLTPVILGIAVKALKSYRNKAAVQESSEC